MLALEFAELSDRGRVRENNEDYFGHVEPLTPTQARSHGWLFALADGVGGQEGGEVASRMAVETLLQGFRQAAPDEPLTALLVRLIERANHQINESASALGTQGMATTVVACALRHDRAAIAHVGDSRCYLLQGRRASVLTQDHTVAAERARIAGHRDAADLQHRHVLSRALGSELAVNADSCEHTLHAGDVLVLCSDGLYASMPADQLASIVSSAATPQDAARELVATANRQDGTDNASVQLIRVKSVEQVGMYRGRPYKLK